jgi:hypothetical protein
MCFGPFEMRQRLQRKHLTLPQDEHSQSAQRHTLSQLAAIRIMKQSNSNPAINCINEQQIQRAMVVWLQ